jgi:predicted nucleic acid-binding protein
VPVVVDASITASWALPDENDPDAVLALEEIRTATAIVPGLWWYEIRNILLVSERRRRLTETQTREFLHALSDLRISIDRSPDETQIFALARIHRLTIYDASYLELAIRSASSLATLDADLIRAAKAEGIALIGSEAQHPAKPPGKSGRR